MSQPAPIPVAAPPRRINRRAAAAGRLAVAGVVAGIVLDRIRPRVPPRLPDDVVNLRLVAWMRQYEKGMHRGL